MIGGPDPVLIKVVDQFEEDHYLEDWIILRDMATKRIDRIKKVSEEIRDGTTDFGLVSVTYFYLGHATIIDMIKDALPASLREEKFGKK